jgi:hypothetical protein
VTPAGTPGPQQTPARRKARQLARHLRGERPDYAYLKEVFRHLRDDLGVQVTKAPKKLPYVPTEAEIRAFYDAVWKARRGSDVVLIKTLLYTGTRVAELVRIQIADVDLDGCRIRITQGKGAKDRYVPFPGAFKETLALHIDGQRRAGAAFLFESSWKRPYSDRGVRKILAATPTPRASPPRSARTSSATSCSPGSKPRASTTRSSSPTAAMPPASPWRSTPASPSPTPSSATTTSSATSPSDPPRHARLRLVTRFLPARTPRVQPD